MPAAPIILGRKRGPARLKLLTIAVALTVPASGLAEAPSSRSPATRPADARADALAARMRPDALLSAKVTRSGASAGGALDQPRRPADFIAGAGDLRDATTLGRAARAWMEQAWDVRLPDGAAFVSRLRSAPGGDTAAGAQTIRIGLPAGDVSGDGLDDALSFELTQDAESWELGVTALRAVRGTDGGELWSRDLASAFDAAPLPTRDMTGDGRADVVLVSLFLDDGVETGDCGLLSCVFAGDYRFHWTVELLSGATGEPVWTRRYDGSVTYGGALAGGIAAVALASAFTVTNAVVVPMPSGDHNGDARPDLVIDALDVTGFLGVQRAGVLVGGVILIEPVFLIATRAEVASAATGDAILTRSQAYVPGGALLEPMGQAVGDGTSDLLWSSITDVLAPIACAYAFVGTCAVVERSRLDLEVIDGASGATAWERTVGDADTQYLFALAGETDFTGDGAADIPVIEYTEELGAPVAHPTLSLLSGYDGDGVWSRPLPAWFDVLGAIGGGPGADLLLPEFIVAYDDEDPAGATLSMARVDGATGADLFTTSRAFPEGQDAWVWLYTTGDADGDAVRELVLDVSTYTYEPGSEAHGTEVESGGATTILFSNTAPSYQVSLPAGDLDGDGAAADLLLVVPSWEDDAVSVTFSAQSVRVAKPSKKRGPRTAGAGPSRGKRKASALLWTRTDVFQPAFDLLLLRTADQTGSGGDDAVYSRIQFTEDGIESRVDGVEGRTGAFIWGLGPALSPPPVRAAISGTVRDAAGAPLEGMCAVVIDPGTERAYSEGYTDPEGVYRAGGLPAGTFVVHFHDCWRGIYAPEWYDDKPDIASADRVVVADGAEVGGIDAVLERREPSGEAPANDDFANAEALVTPAFPQGSNASATAEEGEPLPCESGATVWYAVTPERDGALTLSTAGSDFDTVLAVYTGASLSDLSPVGCNDDTAPGVLTSSLSVPVTGGVTYYVQLGGFGGEEGGFQLAAIAS